MDQGEFLGGEECVAAFEGAEGADGGWGLAVGWGQAGPDVEEERGDEDEHRDGPAAEEGGRAVFVEAPGEQEGADQSAGAGARPHDAVGEGFAADEPFVDVEEDRVVEVAAAEGVEDALSEDEVGEGGGVGGGDQTESEEGEGVEHGVPAGVGGEAEVEETDGSVEIHDSGASRANGGERGGLLREGWVGCVVFLKHTEGEWETPEYHLNSETPCCEKPCCMAAVDGRKALRCCVLLWWLTFVRQVIKRTKSD